jgi:transposase
VSPFLLQPDDLPEATPPKAPKNPGRGTPRLRVPHRVQVEFSCSSLDERLERDSQARVVWDLVSQLDLDAWLSEIKAVERHVGRNATDPRLLVALWVYATLRGVGSARELERLCKDHLAYQWLCGGVSVNYHMLADFRSQGGDKWDELLTQIVATLMTEELVTMDRVAQDGMRVRANAGKSSFRREDRLNEFLEDARLQVETLKRLAETNPDDLTKRQRAARERAARDRQARIEEALRQCKKLQEEREKTAKRSGRKPTEARASITDPEARVMVFANGGYHPGYNVQYATDTATGIIVGVEVTNAGTDSEQMPPMLDQLEKRYERLPEGDSRGRWFRFHGCDRVERRPRLRGVRAREGRGQTKEGGPRSLCPQKEGQRHDRGLAKADGGGGVEKDLRSAMSDGRMGQRVVPQPRIPPDAGARPDAVPDLGDAVRNHTQFDSTGERARRSGESAGMSQKEKKTEDRQTFR